MQEARQDPLLEAKLAVRKWDDLAKDPDMKTPPLSGFEDMAVGSLLKSWSHIELHGRKYRSPSRPTVVVCVDGFDPEYLQQVSASQLDAAITDKTNPCHVFPGPSAQFLPTFDRTPSR